MTANTFDPAWDGSVVDTDPSPALADELARRIRDATTASELVRFLGEHRELLARLAGRTGPRVVIAGEMLAVDSAPEFLVGATSEQSVEWHAAFVRDPGAGVFASATALTDELTHAIDDVLRWRSWVTTHAEEVERKRAADGLGLAGLPATGRAWILLGRHVDMSAADQGRRRALEAELDLEVHRYEWVIARARA